MTKKSDDAYRYAMFCEIASHDSKSVSTLTLQPEEFKKYERAKKFIEEEEEWIALPTSDQWIASSLIQDSLTKIKEGYFGVAYYESPEEDDFLEQESKIIFAHRGTCFDEIGNIIADIKIARQTNPDILLIAEMYVDYILSDLQAKGITKVNVIHTGFSLGGFIAAALTVQKKSVPSTSVTFDAPGVDFLADDDHGCHKKIINYVTVPNLVNTCNNHIGEIRQICGFQDHIEDKISFEFDVRKILLNQKLEVEENSLIEAKKMGDTLQKTCTSHNREKIIEKFSNLDGKFSLDYKIVYLWPKATNSIIEGDITESPIIALVYFVVAKATTIGMDVINNLLARVKQQGIVGIYHRRINKICYDIEDALKHGVQSVLSHSSTDTQTIVNMLLMLTAYRMQTISTVSTSTEQTQTEKSKMIAELKRLRQENSLLEDKLKVMKNRIDLLQKKLEPPALASDEPFLGGPGGVEDTLSETAPQTTGAPTHELSTSPLTMLATRQPTSDKHSPSPPGPSS